MQTCTIDDCTKPLRSPGAIYCAMHYHRWYRHGDPHRTSNSAGVSVRKPRRYRTLHRPSHPLAGAGGRVYAHRAVLYDTIGPGEHDCHWCGRDLDWHAPKGAANKLVVDHLNGHTDDNAPENLVPACGGCNVARGAQERSQALRDTGHWSSHDTIDRLTIPGRRAAIP